MATQQYSPQTQATTDNLGNIVFTFPPPTAQDLAVQGTVSVNSGPAGTFEGFVGPNSIGQWAGGATVGPIYYQGSQQFTIRGSGLLPNTAYIATLQGVVDHADLLDASVPSPLGAPGLVGVDAIAQLTGQLIAAGGVIWPGGGAGGTQQAFFPCTTFAALRLSATVDAGGPIVVECFWFNADATADMGYRRFILGDTSPDDIGTICEAVIPHLGDQLSIKVSNAGGPGGLLLLEDGDELLLEDGGAILLEGGAGGGDATFDLCATHTTQAVQMWGGLDIDNAQTTFVGGGQTKTLLGPRYIFGGPATLEFNPGGASAAYVAVLQAQQPDGTWNTFVTRSNNDPGVRQDVSFYCPAQPIRLQVTNNTGGSHSVDAVLTRDLHRVG